MRVYVSNYDLIFKYIETYVKSAACVGVRCEDAAHTSTSGTDTAASTANRAIGIAHGDDSRGYGAQTAVIAEIHVAAVVATYTTQAATG